MIFGIRKNCDSRLNLSSFKISDLSPLRALILGGVIVGSMGIACAADASDIETSGSSGMILSPAGEPLAGIRASIYLFTPSGQLPLRAGNRVISSQPVQQMGSVKPTNEQGTFFIDRRATGTGILSVDAPPYAQAIVPITLPQRDIRVQLSENGATIRGTVRNLTTGQPVAGVKVSAMPVTTIKWQTDPTAESTTLSALGQTMRAETDAGGLFRIERMPPGAFTLEAQVKGLISIRPKSLGHPDLSLEAGQTLDIPDLGVYEGHTLSGRVLDKSTGQPIAGAVVNVGLGSMGKMGSRANGSPGTIMTDEEGRYSLTRLAPWHDLTGLTDPGLLTFMFVSAEAPNYKKEKFTPTAPKAFAPENLTLQHDFELEPAAR